MLPADQLAHPFLERHPEAAAEVLTSLYTGRSGLARERHFLKPFAGKPAPTGGYTQGVARTWTSPSRQLASRDDTTDSI